MKNSDDTPVSVIIEQLNEPRPLPLGRAEFEEWSDRIIGGACIPNIAAEDDAIFREGQKFALANMVLHLGPTESHKPDAFFIHSLRKVAANQVAHTIAQEIKAAGKERIAAKAAADGENVTPIGAAN